MCSPSPSPAPTSTSQTTSNIPDWAIPYATKVLGNAQNLTDINQNPYQTYKGNRVADFNPLQTQAFGNVAGMTTNAGTGNAMNQTQDAYNRSANAGAYNAQNFGNQYGSGPQFQNMGLGYLAANAPQLNQYQMGQANQVSGNNVNNQNINAAQSNYRPDLQEYQMGPASQVRSQNFGQQFAQDYMSPYQQNVTDFQKQEAVKDYSRALPGMGAKAAGAGAFGGTRHALTAAEGQRNLQTQLGGIQAAGSQNAYQNAQQQFNADQARRQQAQMSNQQAGLTTGQANLSSQLQTQALGAGQNLQVAMSNLSNRQQANVQNAANNLQAQGMNAEQAMRAALANQQAGLTVGQQNLQSQLQTQALGSGQSMQAQLANQGAYAQMQGLGMQQNLASNQQAMQNAAQQAQYGLAGQQAGEASRQFGANYGLQNRQQALAAAGQLGTLGQQQYTQQMGINAAQQQAGAQIQAQEQQGISNKYQDFLNQQNYPYKQLGFMSDIIRGTPTSGGAQSMYQAPPSGISQFAGLAGGLGSLYGGYNQANRAAAGGEIKGYAEGGAVAFDDGGDVVPLPSAAELMVAKKANERPDKKDASGLGALLKAAGMGADLQNLIVAQKQVKTKQQEDTIRDLKNRLAQATGMPEQQNTTVKEDVSNMLRQEVESRAAENAPERQGGIADLDTGNLGDNYAGGGIVAFDDGGDVRHFQTAGGVTAEPDTVESRGLALDAARDALKANRALGTLGRRNQPGIFEEYTKRQLELQNAVNTAQDAYTKALGPVPGAGIGFRPISTLGSTNTPADASSGDPAADRDPATNRRIIDGRVEDAPAAAPAPSTSSLAPRSSGYAAPSGVSAVDSGDAAATSDIADVRRSITDLKTRGTAVLDALDKGEIDPATGQPIPKKTFADIVASQNEERKKALTVAGLPEQGHKERIAELVGQASQARNDRDVDRWMAVAQGFFAMAGGKSQYAMQNMAEGLGVGVKQLQASEKEYRVGEKARLESIANLKQAQRAEELGHIKDATASYEKYQELVQKERDAKRKSAEHLLTTATQQQVIVANKEASLANTKAISDASLAATAATREGYQAQAAARLAESKRAHIAAENQRQAIFYAQAEKDHRLNQKGGPLDKALGELEIVQSRLAAKGKSRDPDLLTQKAEIETRIGKHNDAIANDSAARAKRMMGVGSEYTYVGVQ